MRRNDFDVTDSIRTTDTLEVRDEVVSLFKNLYPHESDRAISLAFGQMSCMYHGAHPDYHPCDTGYHDSQHVLEVTLAMARLLDGYARSGDADPGLPPAHFKIGVVTALFHDVGYLRRKRDHTHKFGAEYTLTHVGRGAQFLRNYLPRIGLGRYAAAAATLVHFTGYERDVSRIRMDDPALRRIGEILGTADIIAQMSDRCYLEKCRERLYPEFVLGGLARRKLPDGSTAIIFRSADDLIRKTPGFYANAAKRLDEKLHRAYRYAEHHFGGRNPYIEEMNKNLKHAEAAGNAGNTGRLRRSPPNTLLPSVRAYPENLVIT